MGQGRPWPLSTERIVKYIANKAAKNMSSLDNQMMVPTLTRFGRLAGVRGTGSVTDAVATKVIITTPRRGRAADPRFSPRPRRTSGVRIDRTDRPRTSSRRASRDKIAVFAIGLARRDIGGYGGSSPRKTTVGCPA